MDGPCLRRLMADEAEHPPCERARLAQAVEPPVWTMPTWCPSCARLAEVVLPYLQCLERRLRQLETGAPAMPDATSGRQRGLVPELRGQEREALIAALQQARGIQHRAAALVGLTPRVMNYRIKQYQLYEYCALDGRPRGQRRKRKEAV